jgi:GAF domain-containing protein
MRRPARAGPKRAKSRPQNPGGLGNQSGADHKTQSDVVQLTRERDEALEREKATAEVLRVLSSSPGDIQPVFDIIVTRAAHLCKARFCWVFRFDGKLIHFVAEHGLSPEDTEEIRSRYPIPPGRASAAARAVVTGAVAEIPDAQADTDYQHRDGAKAKGFRSLLAVPMLKDGHALGVIVIARTQTGRFPEQQIELLRTFADQAVIAIENTRLLNELRESLQQQTATADVLKVISRSTFDLQVVFDTLVESAAQLCCANQANLARVVRDRFQYVAAYGFPPGYLEHMQAHPRPIDRGSASGRAVLEGRVVHIEDVLADSEFTLLDAQKLGRFRTVLAIPLLREGIAIGALFLTRPEVEPFTQNQVNLLTTFADQAVIAIENVRLFEEVQTRTSALSEALEQQTAASEVLGIISRSPRELQPVFQAMLENAARICDANFGQLLLYEDGAYRMTAMHGAPLAWSEKRAREPIFRPGPSNALARLAATKQVQHVPDLREHQGYLEREAATMAITEIAGARTFLAVPMLKENRLVGAIGIYRQEVRPFTDKQIELVKNFASQAVIAIENARLLNEIQDKNRQLQMASENKSQFVSSMSHELRTPLNAIIGLTEMMVKNAARFGTEKAQEPLQRVNRAGTHLLSLINQVLSTCRRSRQESSSSTHKPCS